MHRLAGEVLAMLQGAGGDLNAIRSAGVQSNLGAAKAIAKKARDILAARSPGGGAPRRQHHAAAAGRLRDLAPCCRAQSGQPG